MAICIWLVRATSARTHHHEIKYRVDKLKPGLGDGDLYSERCSAAFEEMFVERNRLVSKHGRHLMKLAVYYVLTCLNVIYSMVSTLIIECSSK